AVTVRSRRVFFDPRGVGFHEFRHEAARAVIGDLATRIEELISATDIGFRLRHRRHVEKDEALAQVMISAESADRTGRDADDRARLLVPGALAIGARPDIDRVLE